jgi:hypothetical protein
MKSDKIEMWMNVTTGEFYIIPKELKTKEELEWAVKRVGRTHGIEVGVKEIRGQEWGYDIIPTRFNRDTWPAIEDTARELCRRIGVYKISQGLLSDVRYSFRKFCAARFGFQFT